MANPGYPPGPMQPPMGGPMGGPPMGGPPMGMPPQQQMPPQGAPVARKGTSKAVPIVVSAGLAIGTFCGLLFGLGTGADSAIAEPSKGDNVKKEGKDKDMIMEGSKVTDPGTPKIDKPKPAQTATNTGSAATGSGSAAPAETGSAAPAQGSGSGTTTAAAGSGAAPASGSGAAPASGSAATPTVPAVKTAKLTIEVTPEAAAKDAKIAIDKKDITGLVSDIELGKDGKKTVALTVKATGYHSVTDQKVEIDGDMTVKIEMKKKAAASPGLPRPGGKKDGKSGKTGGGGLIDI